MSTAADTIPDFTNCTIDGRYKLVKMLGSGTYGVVYKALDLEVDPELQSPYRAMKIIRKAGRGPKELAIIRREVALHSVVSDHPNIVGLHDAYDDENYFYITLDYCDGGDLFEQISEKEVYLYNDELLRSAFVSLIDAVQACHDARIAHRDLKPENVLTSKDGSEVYLADFGLASDKRMMDDFGTGTTIYMAPGKLTAPLSPKHVAHYILTCTECFGPVEYCPRASDVWALGIILINMVSCTHPWQKASIKDSSFARFLNDPDYLLDTLPISESAHDILTSILTANPLRRTTLPELRRMVLSTKSFFRRDADIFSRASVEEPSTPLMKQASFDSAIDRLCLSNLAIHDRRYSSSDISPTPSESDVPGLSPCGSSESCDNGSTESVLVSPEGTSSWKPTSSKDIEEIDWKTGSTANLIIAQYRQNKRFA